MKKYKMKLKDCSQKYNVYGLTSECNNIINTIWLGGDLLCMGKPHYLSVYEEYGEELTMEEIEKMPYGFVNQYDLIEVKEQLYYVELPRVGNDGKYLNLWIEGSVIVFNSKSENSNTRTKFTKQEIEKMFPEYANNTFMVKVEDDE